MLEIPSQAVNISIVGVPKQNGTWNVAWLENRGWMARRKRLPVLEWQQRADQSCISL